jgi:polysaccharide pyruvyl transferase WcaK-like protein
MVTNPELVESTHGAHGAHVVPAAPAAERPGQDCSVNGQGLRVGLFGCSLDTGNRGVSALGVSTISALTHMNPATRVTLFDYGEGIRNYTLHGRDRDVTVRQLGSFHSRRYYRPSNLSQMRLAARLGLRRVHPMLRHFNEFDVIMDVSGGDSFSDIYGAYRFTGVTLPKLLALEMRIPLILLPQTYGPYQDPKVAATAAHVLKNATQVWARDTHSMAVARDLLGDVFDPSKHLCGVDMAFGLDVVPPADERLVERVHRHRASADLLVGLNISGLLYNGGDDGTSTEPNADRNRFGFLDSYADIIDPLLRRLVAIPGVRVLLVPHVTAHMDPDSGDAAANRKALARLPDADRDRVMLVPGDLGPSEVKWVVGQCDWFCGTRMHACIAALSQGVPCTSIAYSQKTQGVFETAGVDDGVVDPRRSRAPEIVDAVVAGLERRAATAASLDQRLPRLREKLVEQHRLIVQAARRNAPCA